MTVSLSTKVLQQPIDYDGTQLSPHWIYNNFSICGHALVAFLGKADVALTHLVDLEDVKQNAPIYSPKMLHFIGEWFIDSLDIGIAFQHLFTHLLYESLWERGIQGLHRRGNDIYQAHRKLNVSIATRSLTSILIHVGINIETTGTPIPTVGLSELAIDPVGLAETLLANFKNDLAVWEKARAKVRGRP